MDDTQKRPTSNFGIDIKPKDQVPDAAPSQNQVKTKRRRKRRSDEQGRYAPGFCTMFIGLVVGLPIFFGSYWPLHNKLDRIEQLGALQCNVTGISHSYITSGITGCPRDGMFRINYGLEVAIGLDPNTVIYGTIGEVGSHCYYEFFTYDYGPDKAYLFSQHGGPRTCYLDPEDVSDLYLDLNDIRATSKGARFVFGVGFLALGGFGLLCLIADCTTYKRVSV